MVVISDYISIILGSTLIFVGCAYLFYFFPKIAKQQDNVISIIALKVASWLVMGGLLLIVLGCVYLMKIVP